jgi:hypothetical protein
VFVLHCADHEIGTIGFFASYAFVHRIYGNIKVD